MNIKVYNPVEWLSVAEDMHQNVFQETRPRDLNRIDFAVVVWDQEKPMGYVTCKEFDAFSVYMGYGGSLEHQRSNIKNVKAYQMILDYLKLRYLRATTLIENTNKAMIKLAMSQGFFVTGIRNFNGSVLLEHSLEWSNK